MGAEEITASWRLEPSITADVFGGGVKAHRSPHVFFGKSHVYQPLHIDAQAVTHAVCGGDGCHCVRGNPV